MTGADTINGPVTAATSNEPVPMCSWFALCVNAATTTRPHPVLGPVSICERCDTKLEAIG